METWHSAQSPFKKLNFKNGSRKVRKSRYQTFSALFSSAKFLYIVPNIFSEIVRISKVLVE